MLLVEETFENNILKHQSVRAVGSGNIASSCLKVSVEKNIVLNFEVVFLKNWFLEKATSKHCKLVSIAAKGSQGLKLIVRPSTS